MSRYFIQSERRKEDYATIHCFKESGKGLSPRTQEWYAYTVEELREKRKELLEDFVTLWPEDYLTSFFGKIPLTGLDEKESIKGEELKKLLSPLSDKDFSRDYGEGVLAVIHCHFIEHMKPHEIENEVKSFFDGDFAAGALHALNLIENDTKIPTKNFKEVELGDTVIENPEFTENIVYLGEVSFKGNFQELKKSEHFNYIKGIGDAKKAHSQEYLASCLFVVVDGCAYVYGEVVCPRYNFDGV